MAVPGEPRPPVSVAQGATSPDEGGEVRPLHTDVRFPPNVKLYDEQRLTVRLTAQRADGTVADETLGVVFPAPPPGQPTPPEFVEVRLLAPGFEEVSVRASQDEPERDRHSLGAHAQGLSRSPCITDRGVHLARRTGGRTPDAPGFLPAGAHVGQRGLPRAREPRREQRTGATSSHCRKVPTWQPFQPIRPRPRIWSSGSPKLTRRIASISCSTPHDRRCRSATRPWARSS